MPLDPVHQLAFDVQARPKLFLCLLGSGVSRAAGVPTGWEIAVDLLHKVAEARGKRVEGDPEAWCRSHLSHELDYATLMEAVAPVQTQQSERLRQYFLDRDDVDAGERLKPPTRAHQSLAALIRRGMVRTVVTTNFDRLVENALEDAGVPPRNVLATQADFEEHRPFHACDHFVVKLHGDWASGEVRNSAADLKQYSVPMDRLLDRLLDEHGLIICGWSATYDVALREALRRRTSRHPCYWIDPNELSPAAAELRAHIGAAHIRAPADEFFEQLEISVKAIDDHRSPENLDAQVVVARAKRLISEKREVELDDLAHALARQLAQWVFQADELNFSSSTNSGDTQKSAVALLKEMRRRAAPLVSLAVTLARYTHDSARITRAVSVLLQAAEQRCPQDSPLCRMWALHPAHILIYAFGVGCAAGSAWSRALDPLRVPSGYGAPEWRLPIGKKEHIGEFLPGPAVGPPGPTRRYSDRMRADIKSAFDAWMPEPLEFEEAFAAFEYVLHAVSVEESTPTTEAWQPASVHPSAPLDIGGPLRNRRKAWRAFWSPEHSPMSLERAKSLRSALYGVDDASSINKLLASIDADLQLLRHG